MSLLSEEVGMLQNTFQDRWKADWKRLAGSPLVGNLSKHLNAYEGKVKKLVRDFDLKSRDARETSRKQIDKFTIQLKRTRTEVEKKVTVLLNEEGQRLNKAMAELFNYLKSMAKNEKLAQQKVGTSAKRKARATNGSKKPKSTTRRTKPGKQVRH